MPKQIPKQNPEDKSAEDLHKALDAIYQTTYYNSPNSNKQIDGLFNKINASLDTITNYTVNSMGVPSISKLYSRIQSQNPNIGDMKDLFAGGDLSGMGFEEFYNGFMQNKYLIDADAEIDTVCKYFPELEEALDIKKEGVLSADHFSKDFLNIRADSSDDEGFSNRIKELKERYNLLRLVDEIYDHTAKYGEEFVYVVPYSTAISKLLTDKPDLNRPYSVTQLESMINNSKDVEKFRMVIGQEKSTIISDKKTITLNEAVFVERDEKGEYKKTPIINSADQYSLNIDINRSGIIESIIKDSYLSNNKPKTKSMAEAFRESVLQEKDLKIVKKDEKTGKLKIDSKSKSSNIKDSLVTDGLFGVNTNKEEIKVDLPGCIVSRIKHEQVIPIYIGDNNACLGYYYLEFRSQQGYAQYQSTYGVSDSISSLTRSIGGSGDSNINLMDTTRNEEMLRYISGELSSFIDKEFVQANQDLRDEIYMILKQNDLLNSPTIDGVRITFIPPEDMIHFYFKMDPITHRGISDLDRSMVPAKIYAVQYITNAIAQLVRGQDKRVFYVRQNVDTNIAQTLMNTVRQIKQGNFGLRQFSNINNVLNITGKFNDFIIPTNASGDSPINMEVLPGQQFTDNTDLMQQIKEMAINSTDVPFEMIQTRQSVDYAMQLSMSSSRFLRKVYHRQSLYAPLVSLLVTKIYNYEYQENTELHVTLPAPMFLNMANTNQLIDNTKNYIQSSTEYETADMDDKVKNLYWQALLNFYLGSQVDLETHKKIMNEVKTQAEIDKDKEDNNGY